MWCALFSFSLSLFDCFAPFLPFSTVYLVHFSCFVSLLSCTIFLNYPLSVIDLSYPFILFAVSFFYLYYFYNLFNTIRCSVFSIFLFLFIPVQFILMAVLEHFQTSLYIEFQPWCDCFLFFASLPLSLSSWCGWGFFFLPELWDPLHLCGNQMLEARNARTYLCTYSSPSFCLFVFYISIPVDPFSEAFC